MKMICYGVRETEKQFFIDLNKKFGYDLILEPKLLTHENITTVNGCEAVMLRANCVADKQNLIKMKEAGVKYVLTRTVGVNHIDVPACRELGLKTGYVPFYSPNAVSELALALGMGLMRNTFYMVNKTGVNKDFTVDSFMFAQEIRNSTIGIIGTGRIGLETAKGWHGMGAKVIGYDLYENKGAKGIIEYKKLDELIKTSDLISIHCPYIAGENEHMINKDFISKMKPNSFIVNASRGELLDPVALYEAIKSNHIKGAALDVVEKEPQIFFKTFGNDKLPIEAYEKLHQFYPRVVITPHIGSFTDEAVKNMVETTYLNLQEYLKTGQCKNEIK
ncbi:NAD(P)-dependent oxidoreductase [Spiroplasma alleghenense]|uniref:D-lactate dehydrogenase n=1 Tax=Spiroplasma alleghenense TaxID=216931 RepID=A0A345Z590_9MOLU|nr:NAD(P)-dependent oxidoreductase [Spiroplasma alleghenense]AXK51769.1 D-lactate dehydrogenase [Spiroplasma alleghenense]